MDNKRYLFLIFAFLLLAFAFISGCGKYLSQYNAPTIISRYPELDAVGIGSSESIWLKFSKPMDTAAIASAEDLATKMANASNMTATIKILPGITPELIWSEDNSTLTISKIFFAASPESKVHIVLSKEALADVNGLFLPEKAELWDFTLSGLYVVSRFPALDAVVTNEGMTLEVTFNNPLVPFITLGISIDHGVVTPEPYPPNSYWTNSNMTYNIELNSWEVTSYPATIEISYQAADIYGNNVNGGRFLKYLLISP